MTVRLAAEKSARLILVRHTAVAEKYQGICYGASDIELSEAGRDHAGRIAKTFAAYRPSSVFHSGLTRSLYLAEQIATHADVALEYEPRIAELDFGIWELQPWQAIHQSDPSAIARFLSEAGTFAPEGGESILAVRDRIKAWAEELPSVGTVIAVSHGGPIAALRGTLDNVPPSKWPKLIPSYGEHVEFTLPL